MALASLRDHQLMIRSAHERIKGRIFRTPILHSPVIDQLVSSGPRNLKAEIVFQAENRQETGSFKIRGAINSLDNLSDAQLQHGVCMTSSGNYAIAMTVAAQAIARCRGFEIPVTAVMPENAMDHKVKAMERCGGTVIRSGASWSERSSTLRSVSKSTGATLLSGDRDPAVLQGQGTLGLGFLEQLEEERGSTLDCMIVPCGTGGLLSGVALALQEIGVKVFGVEPSQGGADDASRGRRLGRRIENVHSNSIADGLRAPLGPLAWEVVRHKAFVEDIVSVNDDQILSAVRIAAHALDEKIEPSAAVGLAAVLYNSRLRQAVTTMSAPRRIGIVLTGGNVGR